VRGLVESDAQAARAIDVSPRLPEAWKKRSELFQALHATALAQPRLFATGELLWRGPSPAQPQRRKEWDSAVAAGLGPVGVLYATGEPDAAFAKKLRELELAYTLRSDPPPPVDLDVPEPYRRAVAPPRPMGEGERALAEALGVEHAVVTGYWDGQPTQGAAGRHERAVEEVSLYGNDCTMPTWAPNHLLFTSAGAVIVADGALARDTRCPLKAKRRCPLVDRRGINFASCPLWDVALKDWLDTEPPKGDTERPLCNRDYAIARLLAYTAMATVRHRDDGPGYHAAFPVIMVRDEQARAHWQSRVAMWNRLLISHWHHIRVIDREVMIDAIVDFRVAQHLQYQSSWPEDRR